MPELTEAVRVFSGLTAITVVFLVAAGALVACNRTVDRRARNVFLACLAALVCIALADWFASVTDGYLPELRILHAALMGLTFAVAPFLPVSIAITICPVRHVRWVYIVLTVHAAVELVSIFGGFVFWIDADNVYHRGTLYPLYMAVYTFSAIYLIVETVRAGRAYQTAQVATVIGALACMFTGVIIQVIDSDVRMTWPAVSMAVVLYFMFYSDMVLRTDVLTMLLNRRSFEDALAHPRLPCVAVIIDVDDFKHVNDTYGHGFGDECLTRVAQMIRHSFGSAGLCYRTGGDEFAVIMTKRIADVDAISSDLMRRVADARQADDRMPGLSIGYAAANSDCPDIDKAFQTADQLMYQAKRASKQP